MKTISAKSITRFEDEEGNCIGEIRNDCFYPSAVKMTKEDMVFILSQMGKEMPEPLPRDRE